MVFSQTEKLREINFCRFTVNRIFATIDFAHFIHQQVGTMKIYSQQTKLPQMGLHLHFWEVYCESGNG